MHKKESSLRVGNDRDTTKSETDDLLARPERDKSTLAHGLSCGLVMLLVMAAPHCFATSLSFVGSGAYNISGNTVVLTANEILNNDLLGYSGTIRLELWAFSTPYPGTTVGYKLASYAVGQLYAGYYYYNISSGSIPFVTPPPGTWYFSLQAREYVGGGGDGYATRDWINFSSPVRVAGGANYGDVQIVGTTSWLVTGGSVNLSLQQVANVCNLGVSGNLRLDLWATLLPYSGGTITGYRFASLSLNPLTGGYVYNNINQSVPFVPPPDGVYYVTLTLSEYNSGQYYTDSYVTYGSYLTVGNPPPAPVANQATGVTTSGFTANWSSALGALGYRVDISQNSTFTGYVSGYQNLDAGNITSLTVSGLMPGTTYYYRVRAYNGVGTSGNSATATVATSVVQPPAPTANAASGISSTALTANWSQANGATGYRLDVSTNGFVSYVAGYQNLDVGNVTSRSVSGLTPGTTYSYRVRAYNTGGASGNSVVISAVTVPIAPVASAASSVSTNTFVASWAGSVGATGYRLDVSESSTFSSYVTGYQSLDVGNTLSQVASGLSPNTPYYYRVVAYNDSGISLPSPTVTVTTTSVPLPPPTLSICQSGTNVVLSWPTNVTGYRVQSATNFMIGGWNTNYPTPVIVAGRYTVTNPITRQVKAYRLFK